MGKDNSSSAEIAPQVGVVYNKHIVPIMMWNHVMEGPLLARYRSDTLQMSFWGATVITNFFTAIPWIGEDLVKVLWGGFSVDNATLNRFFS